MSEEQLSERVKQGDSEALMEFIELKRAPLLAFIRRNQSDQLARKVEADDILQETSVDALRSLAEMDLAERDPFNWLCHIAERRIIDAHRKYFGTQKRDAGREVSLAGPAGGGGKSDEGAALADLLVVSMTSPSAAFSRDQREFKLQEAISQLPEDARTALQMRYIENLPTKEIAQKMGKTDGSIRVLLTRTVRKLGDLLGPDAAPRS